MKSGSCLGGKIACQPSVNRVWLTGESRRSDRLYRYTCTLLLATCTCSSSFLASVLLSSSHFRPILVNIAFRLFIRTPSSLSSSSFLHHHPEKTSQPCTHTAAIVNTDKRSSRTRLLPRLDLETTSFEPQRHSAKAWSDLDPTPLAFIAIHRGRTVHRVL